jgi:hypothetical protein
MASSHRDEAQLDTPPTRRPLPLVMAPQVLLRLADQPEPGPKAGLPH